MKTWIKKVFGFGLASFFSDFSHEMTISFIPVLVTQLVGPVQAPFILGIISSISDSFASFLRLVSGYISDRIWHKKPLIAFGYLLSAVFSPLVGFVHSIFGILLCRMLSFTGSGLREPPRDALIAATVDQKDYGKAFGLKSSMDTIGSLVGPLVAVACAGFLSVQNIFALSFIPGILAVLAIIIFTKDIPISKKRVTLPSSFWKEFSLLPRSFIAFTLILFIFDISCFNKLLLLARTQQMLGTATNTPQLLVLLYAIFNMMRAASEFIIGFLSDYIDRIILLAFCGCGIFSITAFLLLFSSPSLAYSIGIFILFAVSTATMTTLKKACAADMLPLEIRGFGYGILQAAEGFAALIGNFLIGFLWTYYSAVLSFSYATGMSMCAMILLIIFSTFQHFAKVTT